MKTTAGTRLRVGIFVLVALVIGASIAFAIGAQENVFASKTTYYAIFEDVGGLQKGNTVRVAGVNVGSVTEVVIGESGRIEVYFRVIDDATHLIRGELGQVLAEEDPRPSFAAIGSKGLLGDRIIEISVGADQYTEWDPDEPVPVSVGGGIMALAERTLTEAEGTAHNLRLATDPFADQEFSNDLKETARNLAKATGTIASTISIHHGCRCIVAQCPEGRIILVGQHMVEFILCFHGRAPGLVYCRTVKTDGSCRIAGGIIFGTQPCFGKTGGTGKITVNTCDRENKRKLIIIGKIVHICI